MSKPVSLLWHQNDLRLIYPSHPRFFLSLPCVCGMFLVHMASLAFQQVLNFIATSMRKQDVSLTCFLLRRILKNLQVKLIFPQGPPHVNDKWVPQYSCREIVKISILHVDINTPLYLSYVFWLILHNSSLGKWNNVTVIQELWSKWVWPMRIWVCVLLQSLTWLCQLHVLFSKGVTTHL